LLIEDINVDVLAIFAIIQIMIPKLRAREKRSAIINIASCTGVFLSPRVGVYSSTKRTIDIYTRIL
jgi:short-subunit dehydrogenase